MSKKATKPAKKKLSQIELADEIIQKIADNKLDTENLLYQVLLRSPETENFYEMFQSAATIMGWAKQDLYDQINEDSHWLFKEKCRDEFQLKPNSESINN